MLSRPEAYGGYRIRRKTYGVGLVRRRDEGARVPWRHAPTETDSLNSLTVESVGKSWRNFCYESLTNRPIIVSLQTLNWRRSTACFV